MLIEGSDEGREDVHGIKYTWGKTYKRLVRKTEGRHNHRCEDYIKIVLTEIGGRVWTEFMWLGI
jgi:hypothetical protein